MENKLEKLKQRINLLEKEMAGLKQQLEERPDHGIEEIVKILLSQTLNYKAISEIITAQSVRKELEERPNTEQIIEEFKRISNRPLMDLSSKF